MITLEHARHYAYEISHDAEMVERLSFSFERAAGSWLEAMEREERTGEIMWTSTESEREMQVAIEGILSGYARVSLMLFPERNSGKRGKMRGEMLRLQLGIGEDHPIGNRILRNHWMHLDERLDKALAQTGEVPIGYILARPGQFSEDVRKRAFRFVDPADASVYIFGERFDLRALADAVKHASDCAVLFMFPRNLRESTDEIKSTE